MAAENAAETAPETAESGAARERSTIEFPYSDLNDGIEVARGVHEVGGTTATLEQLAAQLGNMAVNGGGFRLKTGTAKTFGLVKIGQGSATLTQLGIRIVDPKHESAAKAAAFLAVPLFKGIFETYKGVALPPNEALEAEMVKLGVARKQKERARQTFQRSAQQAGFFWAGANRLVMPKASAGAALLDPDEQVREPIDDTDDAGKRKRERGGGDDGGQRHPFIAGLLKELPEEGKDWPTEERVKWLQAAAMIFDLIYKAGNGKTQKIDVSAK